MTNEDISMTYRIACKGRSWDVRNVYGVVLLASNCHWSDGKGHDLQLLWSPLPLDCGLGESTDRRLCLQNQQSINQSINLLFYYSIPWLNYS